MIVNREPTDLDDAADLVINADDRAASRFSALVVMEEVRSSFEGYLGQTNSSCLACRT